jgi:flagellar hook-associated protein 1 FlgK
VLAGPSTYVNGGNISYNGWTVQITGAPASGDRFAVGPNTTGTADNRNALALARLGSTNTLVNGTATYHSAYGQLVSDIGNKTRELEVTSTAQTNLLEQAQATQQSLSGVNLDEEAASLLRYQQAYQAAGKVLQIATRLFDTVLELGR